MRKALSIFLTLVSTLSLGVIIISKNLGETAPYISQAYMMTPALAAIITRLFFYNKKFKDSYFRLGKLKDYGRFYFISFGITVLSFAFYTLLCAIRWDLSGQIFLNNLAQIMSAGGQDINALPPGVTPKMMLLLFFFGGLTVFNILPGLITGLGEELGWRDFLFPQLWKTNPRTVFIIGGLIWFLWHLPLSLIITQTELLLPWEHALNTLILAIGSICTFIYLAYVYVESRSVIVTAFAHIVMNNCASAFSYFVVVENQLKANLGLFSTMIIVIAVLYFSGKLQVFKRYHAEQKLIKS